MALWRVVWSWGNNASDEVDIIWGDGKLVGGYKNQITIQTKEVQRDYDSCLSDIPYGNKKIELFLAHKPFHRNSFFIITKSIQV